MSDNTVEQWRGLIEKEHRRAESERLDMGQEGCGCSDCQVLYSTLDLIKYGGRVYQGAVGWVIIREQPKRVSKVISSDCQQGTDGQNTVTNPTPVKMVGDEDVTAQIKALAGQEKSTRAIVKVLRKEGIKISHMTVARRLQKFLL